MTSKPTVAFVGAGRAGGALACALDAAGYPVVAINSGSAKSAQELAARVGAAAVPTAVAAVAAAEITFLTVPDREITPLAATVAAAGITSAAKTIVHCCASQGREAIAAVAQGGAARVALHPLAALAGANSAAAIKGAFFLLESDPVAVPAMERLIADLGGKLLAAKPSDRALYHAAAVLISSGAMALLATGEQLLAAAGADASLTPDAAVKLLSTALDNAAQGLHTAATGPLVRGDTATMEVHLNSLRQHDPDAAEAYQLISRLIRRNLVAGDDEAMVASRVA